MDITGIDLFDHIVDLVCVKVRLRCSWILVLLIYLIKMWAWYVPKLDSDAHGISLIIDLFDQKMSMACSRVGLRCSWISLVLIYLI